MKPTPAPLLHAAASAPRRGLRRRSKTRPPPMLPVTPSHRKSKVASSNGAADAPATADRSSCRRPSSPAKLESLMCVSWESSKETVGVCIQTVGVPKAEMNR